MNQIPLAEKLRPSSLDEVVGQEDLLGPQSLVRRSIAAKAPVSLILWGPPGCGKTSIAALYAKAFERRFVKLSAVFSGVGDIKKVIKEEEDNPLFSKGLVLFVDEIHRFNKAQQDAFLPFIEKGTLVLIGATTENPSFYLNDALLSRVRVLQLHLLNDEALEALLKRAETFVGTLPLLPDARKLLIARAHGDGRYLINLVEDLQTAPIESPWSEKELEPFLTKRPSLFDRAGDQHYNLISALHKSVRGSDPDAALYWFCRMLEGGEDPRFIARRVIRMASEDVGLADPLGLQQAINALQAYEHLGSPEGELAIAQAIVFLALAPKSNALYTAYKAARQTASTTHQYPPPSHILNAPTSLMKNLGYGQDYIYDHDTPLGFSGQNYFPIEMAKESFYQPVERGFERELLKRLAFFKKHKV